MSIASLHWLAWMAGTVAVYWIVPGRWRDLWVVAATVLFLAVNAPASAIILTGFTLAIYAGVQVARVPTPGLLALVSAVVAVLAYYKMAVYEASGDPVADFVIPLGLSYYCFRCIHYLIEVYKGTVAPHGLRAFAGYLFFLPTIVAGPIHRFDPFQRDRRRHRWDWPMFSEGLERILVGYVKVTFLATTLVAGRFGELIDGLDPAQAWLVAYLTMLKNGFEGYLLFAGYSDVAIGFGLLLGYRVMENFNWPLFRRNISEFWRCWHISLSSWVRDYVYTPVVSLTRQPALAALSSMLILALWHEISPRYVLWGLYNGLGIAAWQWFQGVKPQWAEVEGGAVRLAADGVAVLLTFHFVMFGFVMVRQDTLADTWRVYLALFGVAP